MTVQAILLSRLKTVNVAMELVRLPDPFPNEIVRREGLQAVNRFLFHRRHSILIIAR